MDTDSPLGGLVRELGKDAFRTLPVVRHRHAHRELNITLQAMTEIGLSEGIQQDVIKVMGINRA